MPRSLARRTRPTRKLSSSFGGTLPAKTTAVAYSIRYSRRLENSLASAGVTSGPYSLISVCVPAIGSTIAVEVREYPSISTRSNGMAASERPSRMASPLRPPANPAARTGTSRVLRDLATLTPFPPASVMLSGALCLWPSVRLGTTSVLATAALRVTVSIMPLPTYLLVENPPPRYTTPAARARPLRNPSSRLGRSPRPSYHLPSRRPHRAWSPPWPKGADPPPGRPPAPRRDPRPRDHPRCPAPRVPRSHPAGKARRRWRNAGPRPRGPCGRRRRNRIAEPASKPRSDLLRSREPRIRTIRHRWWPRTPGSPPRPGSSPF